VEREDRDDADPEYTYIPWVISTGDDFSDEAVRLAREKNVRLIDGNTFVGMLLDVGIAGIDAAFG
ncbi:MAG: restriction endonuclease, partial [Clostridiales Family XIII bacterium]|jgi:hypothetical protein|nr:restriction endonuclease [Clostridiales Family XIII bacterium]